MMNQKQAGGGSPWGTAQAQEQVEIKPPAFEVPDIHEEMRLAGVKDIEQANGQGQGEEQKDSRDPARAQRGERTRVICCCGSVGCRIGPFTNVVREAT
jgi:hypothetical protein